MLTTLQYRLLLALGVLALLLAVVNAVLFTQSRHSQNELATRGQYIQQSLQLEPIYQTLIRSLAEAAAARNDAAIRKLLAEQGITFSVNPQPAAQQLQ